MFLKNSRYYSVPQVEVTLADGRTVTAVKLRALPVTTGTPTKIDDTDRLDITAQRRYADPTRFWHIADANSELQARDLLIPTGRTINIPET